jgi:glycosyltransferase involved in cell wall biosynthesis
VNTGSQSPIVGVYEMAEPLVSVEMITYNHAPFIAQAIEGVLQQKTTFPFELIIGEDCSTDGTRDIVFEYQKNHSDIIRVITSDKNVGALTNFMRTMNAGRGKYIAFCEGDDYWHHPEKLQKQVDYLEGHPECGLVYTSYDIYHVSAKKRIKDFIKHRKWEMPKDPTISDIVEGKGGMSHGILTCTIMIQRILYDQIVESDPYLHQNKQFLMGDTQLWAEIAMKASLHYIPESMATHNITDESVTRSKDIRKELRFSISGAELMLYLCDKYNLPPKIRHKHETNRNSYLLEIAFHERDKELADEVRRRKRTFTWKEWLRYYGAKNIVIHFIYRGSVFLLKLFGLKRKNDLWQ